MDCGERYDSHAWEWRAHRLVCGRCGVDDLAGRRLVDQVLAGLAAEGYVVVRPSVGAG
jgi:hypothetical protein